MAEVQSPSWLGYKNQGATRSLPLSSDLTSALSFLPDLGVTMEVFSGGQPAAGGGARVGSERHDHGNAADAFFYKDGRRLDWANPSDRPVFEQIVRRGKERGITGFGAGEGYMRPGSMHLGFGAPSVWGAGGKSSAAPSWLRSAYSGGPVPPLDIPNVQPARVMASAGPVVRRASIMAPTATLGYAQPSRSASPALAAVNTQANPVMRPTANMATLAGRTAAIDGALMQAMSAPNYGASMPNAGGKIMTASNGEQVIGERLNGSRRGQTVSNSDWFNDVRGI